MLSLIYSHHWKAYARHSDWLSKKPARRRAVQGCATASLFVFVAFSVNNVLTKLISVAVVLLLFTLLPFVLITLELAGEGNDRR